jgi:hypothetical protein
MWMLNLQRIKFLRKNLNLLSLNEKREALEEIELFESEMIKKAGQKDFLTFVDHVYPGYKVGPHHKRLARIFEEIASGAKKRVIVNIAPRHGKSELISYLAPAWFLGNYPHKKVIMASHTADLAVNFGRRVRNLVAADSYKEIFRRLSSSKTQRVHHDGGQTSMASILQSVLVVLWLGAVPTSSLLMIRTQNKRPDKVDPTYFYQRGSGFSQARCNG